MNTGGLIGLVFGAVSGLVGLIFGRIKAKKERGLDEVNEHIWKTARSTSWYATLITIYILLLLGLLGLVASLVKSLSILLIVHLFSWAITGTYLSASLYKEEKADKDLQHIMLGFFIVLGVTFIVITILFL